MRVKLHRADSLGPAVGAILLRLLRAMARRWRGRLPERPMGADCKSVAKATEVRILYLPPRTKARAIASDARAFSMRIYFRKVPTLN